MDKEEAKKERQNMNGGIRAEETRRKEKDKDTG